MILIHLSNVYIYDPAFSRHPGLCVTLLCMGWRWGGGDAVCTYGRVALLFRVFGGIVFGAMALGQMSHFAPDAGKAQASAARIFYLLDRKPAIDSSSTDGQKPVSAPSSSQSRP